jgi:hypothetical protein
VVFLLLRVTGLWVLPWEGVLAPVGIGAGLFAMLCVFGTLGSEI